MNRFLLPGTALPVAGVSGVQRRTTRFLAAVAVVVSAAVLPAQTSRPLPPPSELKKMTVDQLMAIEVTSVSKRPEKLSAAPSGIQVITGDDIRRAGATSLPEALRLA